MLKITSFTQGTSHSDKQVHLQYNKKKPKNNHLCFGEKYNNQ